jgi:hypothetical protein
MWKLNNKMGGFTAHFIIQLEVLCVQKDWRSRLACQGGMLLGMFSEYIADRAARVGRKI